MSRVVDTGSWIRFMNDIGRVRFRPKYLVSIPGDKLSNGAHRSD